MQIEYKNKSIEKICTVAEIAVKKHGSEMAAKIHQRIDQISTAESVEFMVKYCIGRCHKLHQNRNNQFAVDLVHPWRLIFKKKDDEIQVVCIIEIVDYH